MTADLPQPDRRTVLRRGAAIGAGVWTIPIVQSLSNPAAASSGPPATATTCLKQTFTVDAQGNALTYTPGRERSFSVDLNATFSAISMIWVRVYESPDDPINDDEHGSVRFLFPDGGSGGVIFLGSQPDPITMGFGPGSGRGTESYASLFLDGEGTLIVAQDPRSPGTFALTKVEIEICGTLA